MPRTNRSAPVLLACCLLLLWIPACRPAPPAPPAARVFTDELGRQVSVVYPPNRLVSLAPSVTETLFALGVGSHLVGVTTFCDYPPGAKAIAKIGDTQHPSLETTIALKPDLVIGSTASQMEQFIQNLGNLNIPVYVTRSRDLDSLFSSFETLGDVVGAGDRGRELAGSLRQRVRAVQDQINGSDRPSVLFILSGQPLITTGGGTFVDDLITLAGGESISRDEKTDYPQYSFETAVARKPDVIFLESGGEGLPSQLSSTPAARSGRVYHIDESLLLKPGPRIVDGLEAMAARLHPDAFVSPPARQ